MRLELSSVFETIAYAEFLRSISLKTRMGRIEKVPVNKYTGSDFYQALPISFDL